MRPPRPPLRLFTTALHLALLGTVGVAIISLLFTLVTIGLGLLIIGVGLILLIAVTYALFGVAQFEQHRIAGLYDLDLPPLRLRRAPRPGFGVYLRTLGAQALDRQMWRALASFAIAAVLGSLGVVLLQRCIWAVVALVTPGTASFGLLDLFGVPASDTANGTLHTTLSSVTIVLTVAGMLGLSLLHRSISIGIMRAGAREAALTAQARASADQRQGAVRAADVERTRIERDLHDGVQPRLVSVGMTLGLAQQKIDSDPAAAKELLAEAHTSTKAAITELRQLARGIHASVLDDRGLDAALSALAGRSHVPVQLDVRLPGRCSREAETALYFVIAEALTNAAKHARASECRVTVRLRDDLPVSKPSLWARIEDNGVGGARVVPGGGLDGISNRVRAAGGQVRLDSPQGGPTTLEVGVPCAS